MRQPLRRFAVAAFLAVEAVWAVWVVLQASEGGLSMIGYLAYIYGGALFGLVLTVWLVSGIAAVRMRRERLASVMRRPAVLIQTALLVVVFVAVSLDVGFRVRMALSKSALRAVASGTAEGYRSESARQIGLFRVREVDAVGGAVRFITAECGLDDCGVAYSPSGRPPRVGEDSYSDLGGGGWRWERSW